MQAVFGQKLSSDINLVAQALILIGLWVGFYFARKKQFSRHQKMQTTLVMVNCFFILFIMITSFYNYIIRGGSTTGTVASLMIIHASIGLLAELTGLYIILRMNTHLIPQTLRVVNYKLVMRLLLGLWTLLAIGGFAIYYFRYIQQPASFTTETPAQKLLQQVGDLSMHADEMQAAEQRSNFVTARRHAEHMINLVEGKSGADYGDVDGDGTIQDPGDGTGVVGYLDQVLALSKQIIAAEPETAQLADQVRAGLVKVVVDAKAVIQAGDTGAVTDQINDAAKVADQLANGPGPNVTQLLLALDLHPSQHPGTVPTVPPGGQAADVLLKNYAFTPKVLTVKKGTALIFFNQDAGKHTVTSDTNLFNSGDLDTGQSFSFTFNETGTFPYYCLYHGDKGGIGMAGVINVVP